jgi:hypothetical protein
LSARYKNSKVCDSWPGKTDEACLFSLGEHLRDICWALITPPDGFSVFFEHGVVAESRGVLCGHCHAAKLPLGDGANEIYGITSRSMTYCLLDLYFLLKLLPKEIGHMDATQWFGLWTMCRLKSKFSAPVMQSTI